MFPDTDLVLKGIVMGNRVFHSVEEYLDFYRADKPVRKLGDRCYEIGVKIAEEAGKRVDEAMRKADEEVNYSMSKE